MPRLPGLALTSFVTVLLVLFPLFQASAYVVRQAPDDEVTGLLTLSPTSVELDVNPGQVVNADMTIVNRTGEPLAVDITTEDFEGSSDPSVPAVLLGPVDSPQGAKTWMQPEVNRLPINQGETITMSVKITVPQDAAPGGHYGIFLASFTTPATRADGTGMNVISRVGCYFLLRVAGPVEEKGSLDPLYVDGFRLSGPVPVGLQFNNQGTVHLKPAGKVIIKNLLGITVAEIPVTPWTVLPDASRYTEVAWDRELLFGRYSVEAVIDYGTEGKQLIASTSFWAFSWIILLALLILLILAVLAVFWFIRRRKTGTAAETEGPAPGAALIEEGLTEARQMIAEGRPVEARARLLTLRAEAHRLGLEHEIVLIDDLLLTL